MCELLGLCFNKEVSFRLEFSGLKAGAMKNPDGWGVAWYFAVYYHGSAIVVFNWPTVMALLPCTRNYKK